MSSTVSEGVMKETSSHAEIVERLEIDFFVIITQNVFLIQRFVMESKNAATALTKLFAIGIDIIVILVNLHVRIDKHVYNSGVCMRTKHVRIMSIYFGAQTRSTLRRNIDQINYEGCRIMNHFAMFSIYRLVMHRRIPVVSEHRVIVSAGAIVVST